MKCSVCRAPATLYSSADGALLIELCQKHAARQPLVKSIVLNTAECRDCPQLGRCCRTKNTGR